MERTRVVESAKGRCECLTDGPERGGIRSGLEQVGSVNCSWQISDCQRRSPEESTSSTDREDRLRQGYPARSQLEPCFELSNTSPRATEPVAEQGRQPATMTAWSQTDCLAPYRVLEQMVLATAARYATRRGVESIEGFGVDEATPPRAFFVAGSRPEAEPPGADLDGLDRRGHSGLEHERVRTIRMLRILSVGPRRGEVSLEIRSIVPILVRIRPIRSNPPMSQLPPHLSSSGSEAPGSDRGAVDGTPASAARARVRTPPVADRVLILRLGAMGDVIRTLPAVGAIRSLYPGAHLSWLVEPASAGVVDASGLVDETLIFPRADLMEALREVDGLSFARGLGGFLRTLRQRRFELTVDFHGLLKSGLIARLSGAPVRLGFAAPAAREFSSLFANRIVALPTAPLSRFDRNAALVRALAPGVVIPERPLLKPSALAEARLTARLRASGRERGSGFALVHPGSSAGAHYKRYAPEAWASVAKHLSARGIEVWVAAGPNRHERNLSEQIVRLAEGAVILAPETRSFDDLLALQARAGVIIACDSGPLHAASLAGTPVVQLLGPTHPIENEPWRASPARRLHVPLACSPCRRGCADPACMRAIPSEAVADTARDLLASLGIAGPPAPGIRMTGPANGSTPGELLE